MKKAQLDFELLAVISIIFTLGIVSYISIVLLDKWQEQNQDIFDDTINGIIDDSADAITILDNVLPIILALIIMILLWVSIQLRTSAIFLPIAIISVVIMIIVASQIANTFDVFINDTLMATAKASLPVQTNILRNAPQYIGIIGILLIIATFAKIGGGTA